MRASNFLWSLVLLATKFFTQSSVPDYLYFIILAQFCLGKIHFMNLNMRENDLRFKTNLSQILAISQLRFENLRELGTIIASYSLSSPLFSSWQKPYFTVSGVRNDYFF